MLGPCPEAAKSKYHRGILRCAQNDTASGGLAESSVSRRIRDPI